MTTIYWILGSVAVLALAWRLRWYLPGYGRIRRVAHKLSPKMEQRYVTKMNHQGRGYAQPCFFCATPTKFKKGRVDPVTLKRTREPVCYDCSINPYRTFNDADARGQRTKKDWSEMTTRVEDELLTDEMGEQYPGTSRAAIRAFVESGFARAELHDVPSAATIEASIASLGLHEEVYAETRGDVVVLRRIGQEA